MNMNEPFQTAEEEQMPLMAAAELQDHLLTACNDLERLQTLLHDACVALMTSFHGATSYLDALQVRPGADNAALADMARHLGNAITALQFQDMSSQLVAHTSQRLRNCADRLAADTFGSDEDGSAVVQAPPLRPNPVTQDEMDAGSVELF
jgi:hypothetical protein